MNRIVEQLMAEGHLEHSAREIARLRGELEAERERANFAIQMVHMYESDHGRYQATIRRMSQEIEEARAIQAENIALRYEYILKWVLQCCYIHPLIFTIFPGSDWTREHEAWHLPGSRLNANVGVS